MNRGEFTWIQNKELILNEDYFDFSKDIFWISNITCKEININFENIQDTNCRIHFQNITANKITIKNLNCYSVSISMDINIDILEIRWCTIKSLWQYKTSLNSSTHDTSVKIWPANIKNIDIWNSIFQHLSIFNIQYCKWITISWNKYLNYNNQDTIIPWWSIEINNTFIDYTNINNNFSDWNNIFSDWNLNLYLNLNNSRIKSIVKWYKFYEIDNLNINNSLFQMINISNMNIKNIHLWLINDNQEKINQNINLNNIFSKVINLDSNISDNYLGLKINNIYCDSELNIIISNLLLNEYSNLLISNIDNLKLIFDNIINSSIELIITNIKKSYLSIKKSNLWKSVFNWIEVKKLEIENSTFNDCIFNWVDFKSYKLGNNDWKINNKSLKDNYRQLKHVMDKNWNHTEANKFFALEMEYYSKLENISRYEKFSLWIQKNVNDYWNNWLKNFLIVIWFAILSTLINYFYLLICYDLINFHFIKTFLNLLSPFYGLWKDTFNTLNLDLPLYAGFILYKIIYWILIYQLIIALKRTTKR